jgi:SNF2 family DNA or RNA helicase
MRLVPPARLPYLEGYKKTFPICGDIARRLLETFPDLRISNPLREEFASIFQRQRQIAIIADQEDCSGRPDLMPHQRVGSKWLQLVKRGVLADEAGLGKTVTTIDAADSVQPCPKYPLVVCQKSKINDWEEHIKIWSTDPSRWTVTNYAQILLRDIQADLIILDEAHNMRNRKTQISKRLRHLAREADHVFILTGSPLINEPTDLWPLLAMCDSARFSSYWGFVFRFLEVTNEYMGMKVGGIKPGERANLVKMVVPNYLIRREGILDLPTSTWEVISHEMVGEQKRLYDEMDKTDIVTHQSLSVEALIGLSKISYLNRLAISPQLLFSEYVGPSKLDSLLEILSLDPGRKAVIFSQYAELVKIVASSLSNCSLVIGDQTGRKREENLAAFKSGESKHIALTYKVGGEGMNFQEANTVIMIDYPWHSAGIDQATRRVLRYGQRHKLVEFFSIHSKGTIDDFILKIVKQKGEITIDAILKVISS